MGDALATHPSFVLKRWKVQGGVGTQSKKQFIHRSIADLYFSNANYALAKSKYKEFLKMVSDDEHSIGRLVEISKRYKG